MCVKVRTVLTAAEATAVAIASGGATYADIANRGGNVNNIWSILLGLGTIIPKVLFSPGHGGLLRQTSALHVWPERLPIN